MWKKLREHEATIALITAVIALLAAWLSWNANNTAQKLASAQAFLTLKEHYYSIDEKLPENYREDESYKIDSEDWKKVKRYWYQSFDEWFITHYLNKSEFGELWQQYYSDVLLGATDKNSLRNVLCDLSKREFVEGIRNKFFEEISSLYRNSKKTAMCQ